MAQNEFLQGEITERFLIDTGEESLRHEGGQVAFMTPIITTSLIMSLMSCSRLFI